jgi:hypothetical protein
MKCADCHGNVVDDGDTVISQLHDNGSVDTRIPPPGVTMAYDSTGCSGECHGKLHVFTTW